MFSFFSFYLLSQFHQLELRCIKSKLIRTWWLFPHGTAMYEGSVGLGPFYTMWAFDVMLGLDKNVTSTQQLLLLISDHPPKLLVVPTSRIFSNINVRCLCDVVAVIRYRNIIIVVVVLVGGLGVAFRIGYYYVLDKFNNLEFGCQHIVLNIVIYMINSHT